MTNEDIPRVKVTFPLDKLDVSLGVETENLWAKPLGDGLFEIDNVPFYVYEISCGDVVAVEPRNDGLYFREMIRRGGHSTYRLMISVDAGSNSPAWNSKRDEFEKFGCFIEVAKRKWIAIDVPPTADIDAIYKLLEIGEAAGEWWFEEAHHGHPLTQ